MTCKNSRMYYLLLKNAVFCSVGTVRKLPTDPLWTCQGLVFSFVRMDFPLHFIESPSVHVQCRICPRIWSEPPCKFLWLLLCVSFPSCALSCKSQTLVSLSSAFSLSSLESAPFQRKPCWDFISSPLPFSQRLQLCAALSSSCKQELFSFRVVYDRRRVNSLGPAIQTFKTFNLMIHI